MSNKRGKIKNNPPKAHLYRLRDDWREKEKKWKKLAYGSLRAQNAHNVQLLFFQLKMCPVFL